MLAMDPSSYKNHSTKRGISYHYYFSPAKDAKPTLLFLHGFPSTSLDWKYQTSFFVARGFGVIVPDLLGYGGTDKPTEPKEYAMSLMCSDIIEILDEEKYSKENKVISIGHDW